ncbi:MAG: tetratricopeptide repeat protein [Armatimonadota bacterium]
MMCAGLAHAQEQSLALPPVDGMVEPTHDVIVTGHVYDADTKLFLKDATVTVEAPDSPAMTAKTDALGGYSLRTRGGRVSSKTSGLGWITGSKEKTHRIDIDQIPVTISATGYKPFRGLLPVRVVASWEMTARMEPVLLVPEGSTRQSTFAPGWGPFKVTDLTVTPDTVTQKCEVTYTAQIEGPATPDGKLPHTAYWGQTEMTLAPVHDGNKWTLSRTFAFNPRKIRDETVFCWFSLDKRYEALAGDGFASTLFAVYTTPEEQAAARLRLDASRLNGQAEYTAAYDQYLALVALPQARLSDAGALLKLATRLKKLPQAVPVLEAFYQRSPEKEKLTSASPYGLALARNLQGNDALQLLQPLVEAVPAKKRAGVPGPVKVAMAMSYLQQGDLQNCRETLKLVQPNDESDGIADVARDLRVAECKAALKQDPQSSEALVGYGCLLLDQGQYEEAVTNLRAALKLKPDDASIQWNLNYGIEKLRGQGHNVALDLDAALAKAEQQLQPATLGQEKSRDFFSWHAYAMLLYEKSQQDGAAGKSDASREGLIKCMKAILQGLHCARAAGDVDSQASYAYVSGLFLKSTRITRNIAGFAYPEAQSDFNLLRALRVLLTPVDPKETPEQTARRRAIAQYSLAVALVDLGQWKSANLAIDACLQAAPDDLELSYLKALVARNQGQEDRCVTLLQKVLQAAPRHHGANLELSDIYATNGQDGKAAKCTSNHVEFYGSLPAGSR